MPPPPRTIAPRPIRRAPVTTPRPPELPAGMLRIQTSLRAYRHQLRAGAAEALALAWSDLWSERDPRALDDAVLARLARPEHARHLVDRFDPKSRAGGSPAASPVVPLWSPPR